MSKFWSFLKLRMSDLDYTLLARYSSHSYAKQRLNLYISTYCSFDDIVKINDDVYLDTNLQVIYFIKPSL